MVTLNLGKSSDLEKVRSFNLKTVLGFLDDGIVDLHARAVLPVRRCVCGGVSKFMVLSIFPLKYMRCDYNVSFYCERCYCEKVSFGDE